MDEKLTDCAVEALEILELMVNTANGDEDDIYAEVVGKYNALIRNYGADGLKVGIDLWLANTMHELSGPMPGQMVTVEFLDGTTMSEVEREDPDTAWAARMLLAYISQDVGMLESLLTSVPTEKIVMYTFSLLELCAVNIRAKLDGEDMTPTERYIEMPDL